jgi:hypothetical protein
LGRASGSPAVHLGAAKIDLITHCEGGDIHETPTSVEPCFWSSRGYRSFCCNRERCAAAADFT